MLELFLSLPGAVAHAYNPSYSGGRDQEDPGKIVHETLSQNKKITKKGWWSGLTCRP
jgi:hypothetical protein